MAAPSRRCTRRSRVGWATAHARHGRRAGAGLYGVNERRAAVSREAEPESHLALIFAAARSARNRANYGSGPGEKGAKCGAGGPTAGQPFMAAPCRFGSRKNGRSSPPSAMKNVNRSFRSRRASAQPTAGRPLAGRPEAARWRRRGARRTAVCRITERQAAQQVRVSGRP